MKICQYNDCSKMRILAGPPRTAEIKTSTCRGPSVGQKKSMLNTHKYPQVHEKTKKRFWRQLDLNPHPKKFAKTIYFLQWCSRPLSHRDLYIRIVIFGINKLHDVVSNLPLQTVLFCFTTFRIDQTSIGSLLTNLQKLWTKCLKLEQCVV